MAMTVLLMCDFLPANAMGSATYQRVVGATARSSAVPKYLGEEDTHRTKVVNQNSSENGRHPRQCWPVERLKFRWPYRPSLGCARTPIEVDRLRTATLPAQ
eukprot:scaffold6918_cov158-Amphora_coffeaeformis.AAC.6